MRGIDSCPESKPCSLGGAWGGLRPWALESGPELLPFSKPAFMVRSRPLKTNSTFIAAATCLKNKPVLVRETSQNGALGSQLELPAPGCPKQWPLPYMKISKAALQSPTPIGKGTFTYNLNRDTQELLSKRVSLTFHVSRINDGISKSTFPPT